MAAKCHVNGQVASPPDSLKWWKTPKIRVEGDWRIKVRGNGNFWVPQPQDSTLNLISDEKHSGCFACFLPIFHFNTPYTLAFQISFMRYFLIVHNVIHPIGSMPACKEISLVTFPFLFPRNPISLIFPLTPQLFWLPTTSEVDYIGQLTNHTSLEYIHITNADAGGLVAY